VLLAVILLHVLVLDGDRLLVLLLVGKGLQLVLLLAVMLHVLVFVGRRKHLVLLLVGWCCSSCCCYNCW
jgi:hypothetical protein